VGLSENMFVFGAYWFDCGERAVLPANSRGALCPQCTRLRFWRGRYWHRGAVSALRRVRPLSASTPSPRVLDGSQSLAGTPDDVQQLLQHMSQELDSVVQSMVHLEEYALEQVEKLKGAMEADLRKLALYEEEQAFAQKLTEQLQKKEGAVFEAMRHFLFHVVGLQEQTVAITNELQVLHEFVSENHERVELVLESLRERGLFGSRQDVFEGEVKKKLDRFDPEI